MKIQQFQEFAAQLHKSGDIDPVYPVLKELYNRRKLSAASALWCSALYLGYYNLGSALTAYTVCSTRESPLTPVLNLNLRIGMERRGLFGGRIGSYLQSCQKAGWPSEGERRWLIEDIPTKNYFLIRDNILAIPYIGPWAAFKWLELLKEVHEWPVAAPHMFLKESAGPLAGLIAVMDVNPKDFAICKEAALELKNLTGYSWERLETCLCDYHSYLQGRYRIGHKTATMIRDIQRSPLSKPKKDEALQVCREVVPCYPLELLTERNDDYS